jgi:hypothetical protein
MNQQLGSFLAAAGLITGVAVFVPCVQLVVGGLKRYRARREAAAKPAPVGRSEQHTKKFSEEVA